MTTWLAEVVNTVARLPFDTVNRVVKELAPVELVVVHVVFAVEYPATSFPEIGDTSTDIDERETLGFIAVVSI